MDERTERDFLRDLEIGHEYEDFVQHVLWERGIVVMLNRSARYQWRHGEGLGGIEVKLDRKFRESGNLYIETAERRTSDGRSAWRPCGPYDNPAPRMLAIGDYQTIYLLSVRWLFWVEPRCEHHEGKTQKGYKLPVQSASRGAIEVIEVDE
jgi:hypothetical protein